MGLLSRKKGREKGEPVDDAFAEEPDEITDEVHAEPEPPAPGEETLRRRPLDESEIGDDSVMHRLDLGSIRVPVLADMEVRVELNEQQQPVAASLLHAGSAVQILAFAAPRGGGIWDEVRAEIADSVRKDDGEAEEADGVFGSELHVRLRAQAKQGHAGEQRLRFVGFDGPRWFLRGVFSGPAATNPQQAKPLETVLTHVVVVRGSDPMAPRDALPLRLPTGLPGTAQEPEQSSEQKPGLAPFERGPEITETR
jgi:hypothetical protein